MWTIPEFGAYMLVSGIAQAVAAFTVDMSLGSRILLFISGARSVVLGYLAFRDFNNGAAVWMMAAWIGAGFILQGVAATVLATEVPALPERGWYAFVGILTVIAGVVRLSGRSAPLWCWRSPLEAGSSSSGSRKWGAPYPGIVGAEHCG